MSLKLPEKFLTEANDQHLAVKVSALVVSFFLFLAGVAARVGMESGPNYLPLALSISLILGPGALRTIIFLNEPVRQIVTLTFYFVLGWISISLDLTLSFVVFCTAIVCLIYLAAVLRVHLKDLSAAAIVPYLAMAFTLVGLLWTQDYINPLLPEAIATGFGFIHADTLFHAALTSNIKTYGVPSTGLFGLEPITYHHGAHFLFAAYSKICEMDVIHFYGSGYPVIFVPLFIKTLLDAALSNVNIRKKGAVIAVAGVVLFFILNGFYSFDFGMRYLLPSAVNTHFLSQSYCVSLILTFIIISLYKPLLGGQQLMVSPAGHAILMLFFPVLLFVIGYTKVSTAVVMLCAFFYVVFRNKLFYDRCVFIAALASIISLFGLFELTIENEQSNFQIQFGSYYRHFVDGNIFVYLVTYYLFFVLLAVLILWLSHRAGKKPFEELAARRYIAIEVIFVVAVAGAVPGFLFYIDGGSAYYFADIQYWLTAVALIHYASRSAQTSATAKTEKIFRILYIVIIAILFAKSAVAVGLFVRKNIQIRTALAYGNGVQFKKLFKSVDVAQLARTLTVDMPQSDQFQKSISRSNLDLLDSVRNLPRSIKSRAIIYCEDPDQLGQFLSCSQAIFYLPAMTEVALINGLYWRDQCYVIDEYGMRPYSSYPSIITIEKASKLAAKKGFKYLITLNLDHGSYGVVQLQKDDPDSKD